MNEQVFDFCSGKEIEHDGNWIKGKYPASCGLVDAEYNEALGIVRVRGNLQKWFAYSKHWSSRFIKS